MAAVLNLKLEQGATFSKPLEYVGADGQPIDLTGFTARMQVRHRYADGDLETAPYVDLTDGDGIELGGAAGTIVITIDAATSETVPKGEHRYDLELTDGDVVIRLIQGTFTVAPEVTRAAVTP